MNQYSYENQMFDDMPSPWTCIKILGIAILLILVGCVSCNKYQPAKVITSTVTDKDVKRVDGSDKYLIYTKAESGSVEVFEIEDALLLGQFASSNTYGEIEIGKTYEFTVRGSRIPFLSMYPNICDVSEVVDVEPTTESTSETTDCPETLIVGDKVYYAAE